MISSLLLPLSSYLPYQPPKSQQSAWINQSPQRHRSSASILPPLWPLLHLAHSLVAQSRHERAQATTHLRHEPHIPKHRRHSHHIDEGDPRRTRGPAEVFPPIGRHVCCHCPISILSALLSSSSSFLLSSSALTSQP